MTILLWILLAAALFAAASVSAVYSYGRFAKKARGAPSSALPVADDATALDRLFAPLLAERPGQSGLALLTDSREAFAARVLAARQAGRSLDMLYYLWRDDMAGKLLARELVAAADRGVRVRLLLDDINLQGGDRSNLALNGHPGIEVRLFNPIRNRRSTLRRGLEMLLGIVRLNRRMHCKAWLADGRVGIVGGRNVGDTDFGAARGRDRNARDADLLLAGDAVTEAGTVFDAYWNSGIALPISALWQNYVADLPRFRRQLEARAGAADARAYLQSALGGRGLAETLSPTGRMVWTATARVIADPPEKALGTRREHWMPAEVQPVLDGAAASVKLATPYFVPGREGLARLVRLSDRGVEVTILTNSLAASDNAVVHGAYRRYRWPLLSGGVTLREFAPHESRGENGEMLHSKCFVVDGRIGFVGSFNFDLRSAFLNTEMGVVVEAPDLVNEIARCLDHDSSGARSYTLALRGGRLEWSGDGLAAALLHEPDAPAFRRGLSWVVGHLPIHSYL